MPRTEPMPWGWGRVSSTTEEQKRSGYHGGRAGVLLVLLLARPGFEGENGDNMTQPYAYAPTLSHAPSYTDCITVISFLVRAPY